MKNILSHLYNGNIDESTRSIKDLQKTKEYKKMDECYQKLIKTLNEEQQELFEEYYESDGEYTTLEKERIYANGVKTGMCIALELVDFDLT